MRQPPAPPPAPASHARARPTRRGPSLHHHPSGTARSPLPSGASARHCLCLLPPVLRGNDSSSIFLQNFLVPFSTPALGCQGNHHPTGLPGSGAQSRHPCPQGPSCKVDSPGRDLLRKELPKLGRDGAAEAIVLFKGQPHPRAGSHPPAWWSRQCHPAWSCSPPGWGDDGSPGWGRRRWQCLLQPRSPHGWGGVGEGPLPCNSPQEQTPIALQYNLFFNTITVSTSVSPPAFELSGGSSSSMFFAFLPQILGKISE